MDRLAKLQKKYANGNLKSLLDEYFALRYSPKLLLQGNNENRFKILKKKFKEMGWISSETDIIFDWYLENMPENIGDYYKKLVDKYVNLSPDRKEKIDYKDDNRLEGFNDIIEQWKETYLFHLPFSKLPSSLKEMLKENIPSMDEDIEPDGVSLDKLWEAYIHL